MKINFLVVPAVLSCFAGVLAGPVEGNHSLQKRHCEDQGLEYAEEVDTCIAKRGDEWTQVSDSDDADCDPTDNNDTYSKDKSSWQFCWGKGLNYNPKTNKCYSPARHPSEYNCNWLGLSYDWSSKSCISANTTPSNPNPSSSAQYCYSKGLNYNPSTAKCFNPARHPSEANCKWLGLTYDWQSDSCCKYHGPYPNPPKPTPQPQWCKSSWDCSRGQTCYYGKCQWSKW